MKPVPASLVADALHALVPTITRLVDQSQFTEVEFQILCWFSQRSEMLRPYIGPIVLPLPPLEHPSPRQDPKVVRLAVYRKQRRWRARPGKVA